MALQYVCRDVHLAFCRREIYFSIQKFSFLLLFPRNKTLGKLFFCLFRGRKVFSVLWNFLSGFGTRRQQVLHEFLMMDVHYMQAFPVSWSRRQTPPWLDELAEHINSRHPVVCWLEALLITSAKSTSRAIQNSRHAEARRERSTRLPPEFLRH